MRTSCYILALTIYQMAVYKMAEENLLLQVENSSYSNDL